MENDRAFSKDLNDDDNDGDIFASLRALKDKVKGFDFNEEQRRQVKLNPKQLKEYL